MAQFDTDEPFVPPADKVVHFQVSRDMLYVLRGDGRMQSYYWSGKWIFYHDMILEGP